MTEFVNKLANSKFITWLQKLSTTMAGSEIFGALSSGMGGTMGLIMIGAVCQIICAIGGLIFGWQSGDAIYDLIYMPYNLTMGMMGFFMAFSIAYNYAKRKGNLPTLQCGFTAIICYILVMSVPETVTNAAGSSYLGINLDAMGTTGLFVAMIIGFVSVAITKFAVDHNWVIKLPDSVPEGIMNGFNSIIPVGINIIVWYGLSLIISTVTGGAMNLGTLIIVVLSIPLNIFLNPVGMIVLVALTQIFWFFGLHGSSVIFVLLLAPMMEAYATNAALFEAGEALVLAPVLLYLGANGRLGGAGNTLPLTVMGLKSKSQQISAVCKAELVPSLFGINEPMIFGFPMMYNPIMLIPFVLAPVVNTLMAWAAYALGLMAIPHILLLSCMPILLGEFMSTLDWRNCIFTLILFPVNWLIYYPFFKIYEKQCIENEQAAAAAQN